MYLYKIKTYGYRNMIVFHSSQTCAKTTSTCSYMFDFTFESPRNIENTDLYYKAYRNYQQTFSNIHII